MKRSAFLAVLLLLASLLLLACRKETPEEKRETWLGTSTDTSATASDTATATHPGSPGGTAVVPDVSAGTTVLVVLNDRSIAVQNESIPPGPAVLTVENRGSGVHNLFVEGEGTNIAAGDAIAAGASATMEVQFKPGVYTFYCPVQEHRTNGEEMKVTIAAP